MAQENHIDDERRQRVNGTELTDDIGIDADEIAWRKAFTNFGAADERRLDEMADTIEPVIDGTVEAFYEHLEGYDETVEIFGRSTKGIDQLKGAQRQYLEQLIGGQYEQRYFGRRARIGKIHDMLDLGPKIYLGAYSVFYEHLIDALVDDAKARLTQTDGGTAAASAGSATADTGESLAPEAALEELGERMLSLLKLTNLDQQVAMDTYIHSYSQDIERRLEQQRSIANDVEDAAREAEAAGEEITESAAEISELADAQAGSMRDVAGEVSDMSATVEEIASTADEVAATSDRAEELAEDGRDAADDALSVMDSVGESSRTVVDDVGRLRERVDEIDEVVDVINDIADQTNILALNASIEAARADEAGDGFAVVADEVKRLAEDSQSHAGDIEEMVEEIQRDTSAAVESLEETTEQVERGIERVEDAMHTLEDIVEAVKETSSGIGEVSEATDDQAASTEEVAGIIDELVEQAREVADEIETVAAANEEQTAQIQEMSETVRRET